MSGEGGCKVQRHGAFSGQPEEEQLGFRKVRFGGLCDAEVFSRGWNRPVTAVREGGGSQEWSRVTCFQFSRGEGWSEPGCCSLLSTRQEKQGTGKGDRRGPIRLVCMNDDAGERGSLLNKHSPRNRSGLAHPAEQALCSANCNSKARASRSLLNKHSDMILIE